MAKIIDMNINRNYIVKLPKLSGYTVIKVTYKLVIRQLTVILCYERNKIRHNIIKNDAS